MATRSVLTRLQSLSLHEIRNNWIAEKFKFLRGISSNDLSATSFHDTASYTEKYDIDLKSKLLSYLRQRREVTSVLQNWVSEGRKVSMFDLRWISKQLVQRGSNKHALEVMKWREAQERFPFSETDHALRLELTIKASTITEAEDYFSKLPNIASQKASYVHLLNCYVKERDTQKAESLMTKMHNLGANVTPHPFNAMMKLYVATSKFDLVLSIISFMSKSKIPRNVLSYNIWMCASYELYGITYVEKIFRVMEKDRNVNVGWSSLCTLANSYMKAGRNGKALVILREAENKLSMRNQLGFFFLMTNYTSLKNRQAVSRIWEVCKRVDGKLTCANYMCVILCFVKLKDVEKAERIFAEWESQCIKYDVRVSNILLGSYVRDNLIEKAEAFHLRTLEKGGYPNYKTWEILMEGYIRNKDMEKAVFAMKNACNESKHCIFKPSPVIVESVLEFLEKNGNLEDGMWFLKVLRDLNLANLCEYRILIKMHVAKGEKIDDIVKLMEDDEIVMDDETMTLVEASQNGAKV